MNVCPVFTSIFEIRKFRRVVRKRLGPEELARVAIERPDAAALADRQRDVALLAARNVRIDPLHELRIGTDRRAHQHALVRVVQVPVVARQMLVVPDELAGVGIQRDRRIAVEIGGRGERNRSALPPWRAARVFGIGLAMPQKISRRTGS